MTGKQFVKLVTHKRIPLSCIAVRINCNLATLKALEKLDQVPAPYLVKFMCAFQDSLSASDIELLSH